MAQSKREDPENPEPSKKARRLVGPDGETVSPDPSTLMTAKIHKPVEIDPNRVKRRLLESSQGIVPDPASLMTTKMTRDQLEALMPEREPEPGTDRFHRDGEDVDPKSSTTRIQRGDFDEAPGEWEPDQTAEPDAATEEAPTEEAAPVDEAPPAEEAAPAEEAPPVESPDASAARPAVAASAVAGGLLLAGLVGVAALGVVVLVLAGLAMLAL